VAADPDRISEPIAFSLLDGEIARRPETIRRVPFDLFLERAYWFRARSFNRSIVPLEHARPGDEQVVVHGRVADLKAKSVEPISLDGLASLPSVVSVVVDAAVVARQPLPQVRELIVVNRFRPTVGEETLRNLPGLVSLSLGAARGKRDFDLTVLAAMNALRDLRFDASVARSIAPLEQLRSLERLRIEGTTGESIAPAAKLTALRFLALEAWKGMRALGALGRLERVELSDVTVSTLTAFARWEGLRELWLSGRGLRSIEGIGAMKSLDSLGLQVTGVRDLAPLAAAQHLRRLVLGNPDRVDDLSPIAALRHLRSLEISMGTVATIGRLPSVAFVRGLDELEVFELRGGVVADGRLEPLFDLPRLKRVWLLGDYGDQLAELRRRRPELVVENVPATLTERRATEIGAVRVEHLEEDGVWSISQDLTGALSVSDNFKAEELIRRELRKREPGLLERLDLDADADFVAITGPEEKDLRRVAQLISAIAEHRP